ncbi:hypothetical protein CAter282_1447 [Collimonas arenae]|uniref:Uncharacterized protein n=1 Tax=Collimonas arenae TaxID=279058 RepID=A0A127PNL2_9BURK|nr:hypothetical protein CAter10_1567 [Collimonas arenae]AMP09236.1 hypothetical protein CAter282_1447 [Collimonas arenae]
MAKVNQPSAFIDRLIKMVLIVTHGMLKGDQPNSGYQPKSISSASMPSQVWTLQESALLGF